MSGAKKPTESKRLLAQYERIRNLDARAVTWAKERGEPVTAETYQRMHMSEAQRRAFMEAPEAELTCNGGVPPRQTYPASVMLHLEALQRERNRILSMQVEVIERASKPKDDEERERTWRAMMEERR